MGGTQQTCHVMTCHMQLFWRVGECTKRFDFVLPCSFILSTAAQHLKAALFKVLPLSLAQLQAKCSAFFLVLGTDSGASCLRLGRHLGNSFPSVAAVCRMHQASLAMVAGLSMGGLLSSLFCAALLLRRKRVQTLLRSALRRHLQAHFHVIYEEPWWRGGALLGSCVGWGGGLAVVFRCCLGCAGCFFGGLSPSLGAQGGTWGHRRAQGAQGGTGAQGAHGGTGGTGWVNKSTRSRPWRSRSKPQHC